jgi:hypothetical protein
MLEINHLQVYIDSHTHHAEFIYPNDPITVTSLVSIIIGNYNHTADTLSLVRRIGDYAKEKITIEIIVADTGSNPEQLRQLIDGLSRFTQSKFFRLQRLVLVRVNKDELRKQSPNIHCFAFGINAAARVAHGRILVSCDSSIITPENFVYEMSLPHLKGQKVFVRAPLFDIKEENIGMVNKEKIQNTPYGALLATIDRKMLKHSMGRPAWSVQLQDFMNLGGFDEEMVYYGCGDDDFCTRMLMSHAENIMSKSHVIHLWHPEPRNDNGGYNRKIMEQHIRDGQIRVNINKEWGQHTCLMQF